MFALFLFPIHLNNYIGKTNISLQAELEQICSTVAEFFPTIDQQIHILKWK